MNPVLQGGCVRALCKSVSVSASVVRVCKLVWVQVRGCVRQEAVKDNTFKTFHYDGSQSNRSRFLKQACLFLGTGQIVVGFFICWVQYNLKGTR